MARTLEPLKLDELYPHNGQGFCEGYAMAISLVVKGVHVMVFMHNLSVYVLLPDDDLESKDIILRSEKDILHELREEFGREIKGVKFFHSYLH